MLTKWSCSQSPVPASGSHSDVDDEFQDALRLAPIHSCLHKSAEAYIHVYKHTLSLEAFPGACMVIRLEINFNVFYWDIWPNV